MTPAPHSPGRARQIIKEPSVTMLPPIEQSPSRRQSRPQSRSESRGGSSKERTPKSSAGQSSTDVLSLRHMAGAGPEGVAGAHCTKPEDDEESVHSDDVEPVLPSPQGPVVPERLLRIGERPRACTGKRYSTEGYMRWKDSVGIPQDSRVFVVNGGYGDIRRALIDRGWIENVWDPDGPWFDFKWTLKKSDIDFDALEPPQQVNHYEKCAAYATKVGLNAHLKEARNVADGDIETFYPRTFHLCGPEENDAFLHEFKAMKAESLLKQWLKSAEKGPKSKGSFPDDVINLALVVSRRRIANIDALLDEDENEAEIIGFYITEDEWAVLHEVDLDDPGKELSEMERLRQARIQHGRAQVQTKAAVERSKLQLQKLAHQQQQKAAKMMQERLRQDTLRRKLRKSVLGAKASAYPQSKASLSFSSSAPASSAILSQAPEPKLADDTNEYTNEQTDQTPDLMQNCFGHGASLAGQELLSAVRETLRLLSEDSAQFALNGSRNVWILKPAGRSRGVGIFLSNNLQEIIRCGTQKKHMSSWICQKYIENPLLLDGRKHDLRQWVLVTSWNPLTIWFYGEAYVRLAAEEFHFDDIANNMSHLTNNAIAHNHPNFDKEDEYWRCMWDEVAYTDFLRKKFGSNVYTNTIVPAMKQAVITSLSCTSDTCASSRGVDCCFELVGFDFMVDEQLRTWILEINSSPSMEYSTCITRRMCVEVLQDAVRVALDGDSGSGEKGLFELLYTGNEVVSNHKTPAALSGLLVEGRRMEPPQAPPPHTPPDPRESMLRLAERRSKEIADVVERQRKMKEKEQKQKERRERIQKALRKKSLGRRSSSVSSVVRESADEQVADLAAGAGSAPCLVKDEAPEELA